MYVVMGSVCEVASTEAPTLMCVCEMLYNLRGPV